MKFRWMPSCRRRLESGAAAALTFSAAVVACGPEFPNSYYAMPERELLAAPEGFFAAELARLDLAPSAMRAVPSSSENPRAGTLEVDLTDVRRGLEERGIASGRARQLMWNYEAARQRVEKLATSKDNSATPPPTPVDDDLLGGRNLDELLTGVPDEFADYLRGAAAWHRGDRAAARQAFERVLALPEGERRRRSTWAAFMLGRVAHKDAEAVGGREPVAERRAAAEAFRRVRQMVQAGLPDPLGLAASSLGWEARVALDAGDYQSAVGLYLDQHATGDAGAILSLRVAASRILSLTAAELAPFAKNPATRRVVTAYLISGAGGSRGYDESVTRTLERGADWAIALERAGVRSAREADRMAWLAYEAGQFTLAAQWVRMAPDDSAEANWIRAKLALRSGDILGGEKNLRAALASSSLADAHRARISAELSRVCLARDDYAGALAACLDGGHWEDAAFVAERVMTTAELIQFVDTRPVPPPPRSRPDNESWPVHPETSLRELLARRLTRAGRVEQAERYYTDEHRPHFQRYVRAVRVGFDVTLPARERANAFWAAAQVAREHGMELLGTEMEPDWAIWGGSFGGGEMSAERRAELKFAGGPLAPTAGEMERLSAHRAPEKRFHYRYRAAELAWWAASLLPNDDDETAKILATAGGWLKARDPQAAQPFYQALVIRCGNTALGREAAKKRWFPVTAAAGN